MLCYTNLSVMSKKVFQCIADLILTNLIIIRKKKSITIFTLDLLAARRFEHSWKFLLFLGIVRITHNCEHGHYCYVQ